MKQLMIRENSNDSIAVSGLKDEIKQLPAETANEAQILGVKVIQTFHLIKVE
jgi:hypothetical protein